jgi:hypothetical protein
MRIGDCLPIVCVCLILGCGPEPKLRDGDYARVNSHASTGTWCFDSRESLNQFNHSVIEDNQERQSAIAYSETVAGLRLDNRVKVVEQDDGEVKVQISAGQQCWTTVAYLDPESPNDPAPTSPAPSFRESLEPKPNQYAATPGEQLIGKWQDPSDGWVYAIVKSHGKYYEDFKMSGSDDPVRHELKVADSAGGQKYMDTETVTGDYDVIAPNGSLCAYDRKGFIRTMPVIEDTIGRWRDSRSGTVIAIVNGNGKYYLDLEQSELDYSARYRLNPVDSAEGRKYIVSESKTGEYYVVASDGNLHVIDRKGVSTTIPSIPN